MNRAALLLVLVFALGSIIWASNEDYKAEQREHAHACELVKLGAWPTEQCKNER